MAIIMCPNNHYYDDKRNSSCPYCEKVNNAVTTLGSINEQMTSYMDPAELDDDIQLTEGYGESVVEYEKTIGIFVDESHNLLTVGWLVCVEGIQKGKTYVIHSGRNFVGSNMDMDIVFEEDPSIAPERHFSIVYDPKSISYYLVSGAGHTYLNGEPVSDGIELKDSDEIQVGQNKYIFVPYCKEGRDWN